MCILKCVWMMYLKYEAGEALSFIRNCIFHGYVVFNCRSFCYFQVPGLAVVIVGNRKDSQSYVNMKRKSCAELCIKSFDIDLPEDVAEAEVISKVHELNADPDVHG